jgi:hypothetical protein
MRCWCALVCGWAAGVAVWFVAPGTTPWTGPSFLAPVAAALVSFVVYDALAL